MSKLVKSLNKKLMTLIVSLPNNSLELAKAAEEGGADAIKIHMNITHAASGTVFGSFDDEKDVISEIVKGVKVPVGIVPGNEVLPTKEEVTALKKIGIDFIDLYYNRMPDWMFEMKGFDKVAALDEDYSINILMDMKEKNIDCVEAAIVQKDEYGKDLTVSDLQNYITLGVSSSLPVIVPTQKNVRVSDVPLLWDAGVSALMIGTIVTGDNPRSIRDATKRYKEVISDIGA